MRALLFLLLFTAAQATAGLPDPPFASSEWTIRPAQPTTRDNVVVRNLVSGCDGADGARLLEIDYATGLIDFYLEGGSDVCGQYVYGAITDTRLGYLPPGAYTIRFISCLIPFDPDFPGCGPSSIPNLGFVVTDAGRPRQIIPVWSFAGAFATVLLLAGIALLRLKPRQG
jgi:hypothetical protein